CYVALFPQLIAGPIVRYNTIADQLVERDHTVQKFSSGTALFILGFAKKILLANPMGEIADSVFAANSPATIDAWFGVTAYAFQIYFDFS
ncbi:MAG: MBOAT family protein, partial [Candidatus Omnitrophica bacterium]|nr:MBOAT family protein [Candidatus Omnitrophota bacterium]